MEQISMSLLSSPTPPSSSPNLAFQFCTTMNTPLKNPNFHFTTPLPLRNYRLTPRASRSSLNGADRFFARVSSATSSSTGQQVESVGVNPIQPVPPPSSSVGSPLFWVGVGVGISALFSFAASNIKKYAMQQAMKTMMSQVNTQNSQFSNPAFSTGSPFPFPPPPVSGPMAPFSYPMPSEPGPATSASSVASPPATFATVDVPAKDIEAAPVADVKDETEMKKEAKKSAFVDVSPEEPLLNSPFERVEDVPQTSTPKTTQYDKSVSQNGAATWQTSDASDYQAPNTKEAGSFMSVEALEKMMEDPSVQKMVYPYLPEEMRNPETFKWMLQHPQYRRQLQDMLDGIGGGVKEWDSQGMESFKNFDLTSPEVKQQFDQLGLTPDQVISKIMENPDIALAFQNPRVQRAIMECSQDPYSIVKYQNDKEVMDVFNKIQQLFPGTGPV